MKKREFLAMGGAVPLMLAGCGGDGAGSAPVRLVNASRGYPSLGFMVDTTQATTSDVAYGSSSPFETVQAGSVTTALTVTPTGAGAVATVSSTVRSLSKDSRYSLVAYGFLDELKSVLLTESTVAPDTGKANINVLNTSVDVGAVDVYLSTTAGGNLSLATLIASNVAGSPTQSSFFSILPGTYFVTIVGAGSVAEGRSDVRFTSPANGGITLVDQQIVTIIVTPGASGTLANVIVLTQGTSTSASTPVSYLNTTARLRVVTAAPAGTAVTVAGILSDDSAPEYTNYSVLTSLTVPTVTVNGTAATFVGAVIPPATLMAGGDYTMMVYTDASGANPQVSLVLDDNTAPVSTSGVKFRLINLAYDNQGLSLGMKVNGISIASGIKFGGSSTYTEVTAPQTTNSVVEVISNATTLVSRSLVLIAGNIFTEIIVSDNASATPPVQDFFSSASGV